MSNWHKKVEYICQCGQNYGSCGDTGKIILRYLGVADTYQILYKGHKNEQMTVLGYFDDESLSALAKLLNSNFDDLSNLSREEFDEVQIALKR